MATRRNTQELIDRIYEAAVFTEQWPETLDLFGQSRDGIGAVMAARRSDEWTGFVVSPAIAPGVADYLASPRSTESLINRRFLADDRAGWARQSDYVTAEEWARDPLLTDWVAPSGGDQVAATWIQIPSGETLIIQINRAKGKPEFDDEEIACLDGLRPHFARAGLLAARWRLERLRVAAEAIAALGLPALILNQESRVLAANSLIEGETRYLRWLPKDRISLADSAAETIFRQGLRELGNPEVPCGRSFAARSAAGDNPVVLHLIPTPGQARDLFDGALALLVMTPVAPQASPDMALIRGLFDLSPNESKVARAITQGLTANEIALRHGVGEETVRSQIKSVLSKTGTRNRTAAAALFGGLSRLPVGQ